MIVVADTSPLNYFVQIGCESILPSLYQRVLIPRSVLDELGHPNAPNAVAKWLLNRPDWIDVRSATGLADAGLADLDPGEREAIQLAQQQGADLLLIDERRGRLEADRRGLTTTGTLGVLLDAAKVGLIEAAAAYHQLTAKTNFRCSPKLEKTFLQRVQALSKDRS